MPPANRCLRTLSKVALNSGGIDPLAGLRQAAEKRCLQWIQRDKQESEQSMLPQIRRERPPR
jgi:hypothetical protein